MAGDTEILKNRSFLFHSEGFDKETFFVTQFEGSEAISKPFHFSLTLAASKGDIDLDKLVESSATFSLVYDETPRTFKGRVMEADFLYGENGLYYYRVDFHSPMWRLSRFFECEAYIRKTVPDILDIILKKVGLTKGEDYETQLQVAYRTWSFQLQYHESALSYLHRLLEREGIYYYVDPKDNKGKIIFTDNKTGAPVPKGKLIFHPLTGLDIDKGEAVLRTLSVKRSEVPKTVKVRDFNYRRATKPVEAEATVSDKGYGEKYLFGEHLKDSPHAESIAKIRAEELSCREKLFVGTGAAYMVSAGGLVDLKGHPRDDYNSRYLVVSVEHQGSRSGELHSSGRLVAGDDQPFYKNSVVMIPGDLQFRPELTTERPSISGTLNAVIDAEGDGQYAEVDEYGRYKVRLPFAFTQDQKDGKASRWMRMATPYAGSDHGMHFPLHKGTEVALAFTDGDPDRPYIAYAMPNSTNASIVNADNRTMAKLKSAGGNVMSIEDQEGSQRILWQSPSGASWFRMGAPNDPPSVDFGGLPATMRLQAEGGEGGEGGHGESGESYKEWKENQEKYKEEKEKTGFAISTEGDYGFKGGGSYKVEVGGNAFAMTMGGEEKVVIGFENKTLVGGFLEIKVAAGIAIEVSATLELGIARHFEIKDGSIICKETEARVAEQKLEAVESSVEAVGERVTAVGENVTAVEDRMEAAESDIRVVGSQIAAVDTKVEAVETRVGATETAVEQVGVRVGAVETSVEQAGVRIRNCETNIEENAVNIQAGEARITQGEADIQTLATIITAVEEAVYL